MNKIKVTPTEKKILDAVKAAKRNGFKVVEGGWFIRWNQDFFKFETCTEGQCCPLGAVLINANLDEIELPEDLIDCLEQDPEDADLLAEAAAHVLDKRTSWVESFVGAFDSGELDEFDDDPGEKAGVKIRKVVLK